MSASLCPWTPQLLSELMNGTDMLAGMDAILMGPTACALSHQGWYSDGSFRKLIQWTSIHQKQRPTLTPQNCIIPPDQPVSWYQVDYLRALLVWKGTDSYWPSLPHTLHMDLFSLLSFSARLLPKCSHSLIYQQEVLYNVAMDQEAHLITELCQGSSWFYHKACHPEIINLL